MSKDKRNKMIQTIENNIKGKSLVFIDYKGINVADFTDLRNRLKEKKSSLKVFKNTLTIRAMKKLKIDINENFFKEMTATAISQDDDFMSVSKDILEAEKNKKIKIKGGVFNGEILDSQWVRKYATIHNKQDLYSMLVAILQHPISQLVFVLEEIKKNKNKNSQIN
jgi:large subunit ribosomal protein L10